MYGEGYLSGAKVRVGIKSVRGETIDLDVPQGCRVGELRGYLIQQYDYSPETCIICDTTIVEDDCYVGDYPYGSLVIVTPAYLNQALCEAQPQTSLSSYEVPIQSVLVAPQESQRLISSYPYQHHQRLHHRQHQRSSPQKQHQQQQRGYLHTGGRQERHYDEQPGLQHHHHHHHHQQQQQRGYPRSGDCQERRQKEQPVPQQQRPTLQHQQHQRSSPQKQHQQQQQGYLHTGGRQERHYDEQPVQHQQLAYPRSGDRQERHYNEQPVQRHQQQQRGYLHTGGRQERHYDEQLGYQHHHHHHHHHHQQQQQRGYPRSGDCQERRQKEQPVPQHQRLTLQQNQQQRYPRSGGRQERHYNEHPVQEHQQPSLQQQQFVYTPFDNQQEKEKIQYNVQEHQQPSLQQQQFVYTPFDNQQEKEKIQYDVEEHQRRQQESDSTVSLEGQPGDAKGQVDQDSDVKSREEATTRSGFLSTPQGSFPGSRATPLSALEPESILREVHTHYDDPAKPSSPKSLQTPQNSRRSTVSEPDIAANLEKKNSSSNFPPQSTECEGCVDKPLQPTSDATTVVSPLSSCLEVDAVETKKTSNEAAAGAFGRSPLSLKCIVPALNKTILVELSKDATLNDLMMKIVAREPSLAGSRVIFSGRLLEPLDRKLIEFGIRAGAFSSLVSFTNSSGAGVYTLFLASGEYSDPKKVMLLEIEEDIARIESEIEGKQLTTKQNRGLYEELMRILFRIDSLQGLPDDWLPRRKKSVARVTQLQDMLNLDDVS